MHISMHACINLCLHASKNIHVCIYVCMDACINPYVLPPAHPHQYITDQQADHGQRKGKDERSNGSRLKTDILQSKQRF